MSNTKKMNELEELGRVDAEKAYTEKGKENLKAEKKRVVKEIKSREGRPYFFSMDTYLMMTRLPFAMIRRESLRIDRPEYLEDDYSLNEPISDKINTTFEKDGLRVEKNTNSNNIKAFSLADIV